MATNFGSQKRMTKPVRALLFGIEKSGSKRTRAARDNNKIEMDRK
jgi:hypothetical protein